MSKLTTAIATLGIVAGLGVAALPLSSYATTAKDPATVNTAVKATVGKSISLTAPDTVTIADEIMPGGDLKSADATLTVETNSVGGYNLEMSSTSQDMTSTGGDTIGTSIITSTSSVATSAWGAKAASTAGNVTIPTANKSWFAIPASANIATGGTKTSEGGDAITVTFGVVAAANQASGVYTGNVTFTATAKD